MWFEFIGAIVIISISIVLSYLVLNQSSKERREVVADCIEEVIYDANDNGENIQSHSYQENQSDLWQVWGHHITVTQNNTVSIAIDEKTDNNRLYGSETVYSKTIEEFCGLKELPSKIRWKIKNSQAGRRYDQDSIGIVMGISSCDTVFNAADCTSTATTIQHAGVDYYVINGDGTKQSRRKTLGQKKAINFTRSDGTYLTFDGFGFGDDTITTIEFDIDNKSISLWTNNTYFGKVFDQIDLPKRKVGRCRLTINLSEGSSYSLINCTVVPRYKRYTEYNINTLDQLSGLKQLQWSTNCDQLQTVFGGDKQWERAKDYYQNNPWCD